MKFSVRGHGMGGMYVIDFDEAPGTIHSPRLTGEELDRLTEFLVLNKNIRAGLAEVAR